MGGMSASDAAPLPRLGEVFFDVRGDSRSMRLSWYADTGVAVLSIWQGGMCTGTFRLAIADLPRMVETLQRGPRGQRQEWDPEAPGEVFAQVPRVAAGQGQAGEPLAGQHRPDHAAEQAEYRTRSGQYQTGQYQTGPYQTARHQAGRHQTAAHQTAGHAAAGHQTAPRQTARRQTAQYLAEPGPLTGTAEYPTGPPDHLAAPSRPHPVAPEYLAELADDPLAGAAPRPPAPPDPLAPPPEYLPAPPDPLAAPPEYLPAPSDQRTQYLTDLPGTGPAAPVGYDGPPSPPGAGHPLADASGPYPPGTSREALANDSYFGGTGPVDYPDPHSPPGPGDVVGPDYPAHYGGAVTDDILPDPVLDSGPHGRPQGQRRAASRHAAPDVPFD
jgi:hypothetical protein